jgi:hypothetical protein
MMSSSATRLEEHILDVIIYLLRESVATFLDQADMLRSQGLLQCLGNRIISSSKTTCFDAASP